MRIRAWDALLLHSEYAAIEFFYLTVGLYGVVHNLGRKYWNGYDPLRLKTDDAWARFRTANKLPTYGDF